MVRCLVSGAGGFVGGHLVRELQASGHEVVAAIHHERSRARLPRGCAVRLLEILDPRGAAELLAEVAPEMIFHLGAMTFVPAVERQRSLAFASNAGGTLNLLEGMSQAVPEARFLLVSSAHVYAPCERAIREEDRADPPTFYGLTKRAAEQVGEYFRRKGLAVLIARAFNHIGPGQSESFVTSSFARQIARIERGESEPLLEVGNLEVRRDFTDVRDVVRAYRMLLDGEVEPATYNVASGRAVAIAEILDRLLRGSTAEIEVRTDASRLRPGENPLMLGDARRLRACTGWMPRIPLERSLNEILEAARARE